MSSEERVQMYITDGAAESMGGDLIVCAEGECSPDLGVAASEFDIDDCDGYLDETMLDEVINADLEWNNNWYEDNCEDTELFYYLQDEDDLDNPDETEEANLVNLDNWWYIFELNSCSDGENSFDITSQFIDDLTENDDDEIAYSWWAGGDDISLVSGEKIKINYCRACPDEDGDGYTDEGYECGTQDDCDDYNQYINPSSNVYCDCNPGTGGGATQGIYEICDNIDNDCDGSIDEGLSQGCGLGICSGGTQSCSAGSWGSCSTSYLSTTESCNNLNDDCDDSVDENIASQECGIDTGACVKGTQSCSAGSWGACGGTYVGPINETCNSIDDNCNGVIDESNVCGNYPNITLIKPVNNYISYNGSVIFNCSSVDNNGLANITLYHNITGNMTANSTKTITGLSNSTSWTINNIPNQTIFVWNCLAYDINSHWSWSVNGPYYVSIILSLNDTTPPTYTQVSTNNTAAGQITRFSINVTDNSALHPKGQYIFSTNNTGIWVNNSAVNFTSTPSWANVTKTLNSTVGLKMGYRWYITDNAGNKNSTPIYVLTTTVGYNNWYPNSTINSSLTIGNDNSRPFVFYKDSSWYMINGNGIGTFEGWVWDTAGNHWHPNSTINNSLGDAGYRSAPTVFQMGTKWYLITGANTGISVGYVLATNGTTWLKNTTIIASLSTIYYPDVFQKDGDWYMINGKEDGTFGGWVWDAAGAHWHSNTTVITGLPDIGNYTGPSVFYKDSSWYLIAGDLDTGAFRGFAWNGTQWNPNSIINASLPSLGYSYPSVFYKDSSWYLLSGGSSGNVFYGFKYYQT
jgi:hypothetical protein